MSIFNIGDTLERIANVLEGKETIPNEKVSPKDFSIIIPTEEETLKQEDEEIESLINTRLKELDKEGNKSFFEEDDIRDILGEINEF